MNLIIGMGKTGESIGRWLQRQNQPFVFYDTRPHPPQKAWLQQQFPGVRMICAAFPDDMWPQISRLFVSPGVDTNHALLEQANKRQLPITNDIDCLFQSIADKTPVVAITGTNGKSTVTDLVGLMAQADGKTVSVAGNIGEPVLDQLEKSPHSELWVLELSSFQLALCNHLQPAAATILNISPDHLDRHKSLTNYIAAKQTIYQRADLCVYNRGDDQTLPSSTGRTTSFGLDQPASADAWGIMPIQGVAHLCVGNDAFLSTASLQMKGQHFWLNALAAAALATEVNISLRAIKQVLSTYTGLPYRTQWVRTLNQVDYINDSKGTNVGATISAINGIAPTVSGHLWLIAGGQGKGADFTLLQASVDQHVRAAYIYGEDGPAIVSAIADHTDATLTKSLSEALTLAHRQAQPGDCILFSPACASFDDFKDFNHRGETFNQLVQDLS